MTSCVWAYYSVWRMAMTPELLCLCMELPRARRSSPAPLHYTSPSTFQMYTKLRPGVRRLLAACAPSFEMWIHTNGTAHYADAVVPLLDPDGAYFARRVLAQGGPRAGAAAETPDRPKALDRGLAGREAVALILDDTDAVRGEIFLLAHSVSCIHALS